MRRTWTAAVGALLVLGAPAGAGAAERGVHVDPGSPAGKEYAIPIERARREASGGTKITSAATTAQPAVVPLFGQGIKPPPKRPKHKKAATKKGTPVKVQPVSLAPTAAVEAALARPSTTAWTGAIPAAVLAGGILLALGLRRRRV